MFTDDDIVIEGAAVIITCLSASTCTVVSKNYSQVASIKCTLFDHLGVCVQLKGDVLNLK